MTKWKKSSLPGCEFSDDGQLRRISDGYIYSLVIKSNRPYGEYRIQVNNKVHSVTINEEFKKVWGINNKRRKERDNNLVDRFIYNSF